MDRTCDQLGSFKETGNERTVILTFRKEQLNFLGPIMKKEGL